LRRFAVDEQGPQASTSPSQNTVIRDNWIYDTPTRHQLYDDADGSKVIAT